MHQSDKLFLKTATIRIAQHYNDCRLHNMTKSVTLYHHPTCSKSRATFELLQQHEFDIDIVDYVKQPPNLTALQNIIAKLGIDAMQLLRVGEPAYKQLGLDKDGLSEEEALLAMLKYPILIERPIVIYQDKAAIGRPIENIVQLLELA